MALDDYLDYHPDVKQALADGRAVVALESTIISHGLPWPTNRELALELEQIIRNNNAVPATLGIINGRLKIGMTGDEVTDFAVGSHMVKVSRRDLGSVLALGQSGATTVES